MIVTSAACRAVVLAVLFGLAWTAPAWAHASLVRADPADGAVVAQPPAMLTLTFNEPVSPLIMRLIGPSGEVVTPEVKAENATVTLTPPQPLRPGSHVLSWRVISADGHPVGGSVLFSVGAPSANARGVGAVETDRGVAVAIWAAKLALYLGLFVGVGGAAFVALFARKRPLPGRSESWIAATMVCGLLAAVLSVGLQGLDALALPLPELRQLEVWRTGLDTSYGTTALIAAAAFLLGLAVVRGSRQPFGRLLAALALAGVGVALAASGHAGTAAPRLLSRPSVFLHGVCVAFWIGALLPLLAVVRAGRGTAELARFSRAIPFALAALAATGVVLAWIQLDHVDALWTTRYGQVLSGKLALVAALLGLAAANRYVLVPRFEAGDAEARRPLVRSVAIELAIALAILGAVALWRFTPPPRALAAVSEQVSIHFHGQRAMAQIEIEPMRARGAELHLMVMDGEFRPLAAKEVTLVFSNPAAGIEPVRRAAILDGEASWRIDDLRIPVAGRWRLRVEILITDFDKVTLEDDVALPRLP
jgi:copper transport protein